MSNTTDPSLIFITELKKELGPDYQVTKVSNEMYRVAKGDRATKISVDQESFTKHSPQAMAQDIANRVRRLFV